MRQWWFVLAAVFVGCSYSEIDLCSGNGAVSSADVDCDTIPNERDNCLLAVNEGQADTDGDTVGDACDPVDDRECFPGTITSCGNDEGECSAGSRTCDRPGYWGACFGGTGPTDETCDNLDNDCDGEKDEGLAETRYLDWDGDGYGDPVYPRIVCSDTPIEDRVPVSGDCNDSDHTVHPWAHEYCDERDNDCDRETDEGCPVCNRDEFHFCEDGGDPYPAIFCESLMYGGAWAPWIVLGQTAPSECAEDTWCAVMDRTKERVTVMKFFLFLPPGSRINRLAFKVVEGRVAGVDAMLILRGFIPGEEIGWWTLELGHGVAVSGASEIVFNNIVLAGTVALYDVELYLRSNPHGRVEVGDTLQFGITDVSDIDVGHPLCFQTGMPLLGSTKIVVEE